MKDINPICFSNLFALLARQFLISYTLLLLIFFAKAGAAQTADFSFNTLSGNFCVPATMLFSGIYSEAPKKVIWNFGIGGETSQELTPSFLYSQPGDYKIKLSVLFNTKLVVVEKTIQVFGPPSLIFTSSQNYLCQPGAVSFTARSFQRIASAVWNMGDGSIPITNTDTVFNHAYNNWGSYTPSVTIRD
jgi:PKD repeat protein